MSKIEVYEKENKFSHLEHTSKMLGSWRGPLTVNPYYYTAHYQ